MIIYGYRNREIEQASGSFYCPKCGAQRPYKHKKIVGYFMLFFIPLFPLGKLSEYVECQVCLRTFQPHVLSAISSEGLPQANEDLLNVEPDGFSSTSDQKTQNSNSCLVRGLTMGGALGFLFGCFIAIGATLVQINLPDDREGFLAFMAVCPMPMIVAGIVLLVTGLLLQARKWQITDR